MLSFSRCLADVLHRLNRTAHKDYYSQSWERFDRKRPDDLQFSNIKRWSWKFLLSVSEFIDRFMLNIRFIVHMKLKKQACKPNALTFDASSGVWLNFWIRIWLNKPLNMTICSFSSFISWLFSNMLSSVSWDGYLDKQKWKGRENSGEVRNSSSPTRTERHNISKHLPWFFLLQRICFFLKFRNLLILPRKLKFKVQKSSWTQIIKHSSHQFLWN